MDIAVWLRSLSLGKYEAAFRENDIDETVLPGLTHETLKELGVVSVGHRVTGFGSGGSFLGTAASTAAGVIGGGLLLNSIRSMFGEHAGLGGHERSALDSASGGGAANNILAQRDRDQDQDQDQDDDDQAQADKDQDQDQDQDQDDGALDGFGLAKWVREHRPGLDVILAGTLPRTVETAKKLCEEGPIPKPYEAQAVHGHIRRLLATRKTAKPPDRGE